MFEDRAAARYAAPEGTAPICRAYLEHGLHREPQPEKLYTIGADVPLRSAPEGPLSRALAAVGRGDRLGRPRDRRRGDPAVWHGDSRRLGVEGMGAAAELDRRRDVPSGLRREARRVARRERRALDDEARAEARDEPAARLRRQEPERPRGARRRAEDRRIPVRRLREHFARSGASWTRTACAYELVPTLVRGLDYYTRTTWEFVGPDEGAQSDDLRRRPLRRTRRGDRRPADAGGRVRRRASSGCRCSSPRASRAEALRSTSSSRSRRRPREPVLALMADSAGTERGRRLRRPLAQGPADPGRPARRPYRRAGHGRSGHLATRRRRSRRADPGLANCGRRPGHPGPPPAMNANPEMRACLTQTVPRVERP